MKYLCCLAAALVCATIWAQETSPTAPISWRIARENFTAPLGAIPPKLVTAQYSSSLQGAPDRTVSVSFDISEKGLPFNIQVQKSPDTESSNEVIALIREWRFEAATKDGFPVQASGFLDLTLLDLTTGRPALLPNGRPVPRKAKK